MSDQPSEATGTPSAASPTPPAAPPSRTRLRRLKIDVAPHAAKLTAVLAVLAAVASGQYALQVSHTTLAQAEATDKWGYYQAKSIKKNVAHAEARTIKAVALVARSLPAAPPADGNTPDAAPAPDPVIQALADAATRAEAEANRYDNELDGIKEEAEALEKKKRQFQRKGDFFNLAFVALQAGVILATVADNGKRKGFLLVSLVAGLAGAALAGFAFLIGF